MRLGVMWPGVMPDGPGKVDGGYLASVGRVVDALWKRGVHSILELHQDMLSPHLCGEGAPLWANLTPAALGGLPLPLPVGGSALPLLPSGLPNCSAASTAVFPYFYGSDLVGRSFAAIYQDQPPQRLGTQLKIFWGEVARHFATRDGVLAYELLNEPWIGGAVEHPQLLLDPSRADRLQLAPFYENLHHAIRQFDNDTLLLYSGMELGAS